MFECASCPISFHRHCLFEWAADHAPSVSEALAAGQTILKCVRCSFMRPHLHKFFLDAVGTEEFPVIVIPLPLRYTDKHGELLMERANKLAEHYGAGCLAPGGAAITPQVRGDTPRSTVRATPEEIRLMEENKLQKGVAEQLRTSLQVQLKASIAEGMTVEEPHTARRKLGNTFEAPQKDTGKANVGQQQPALIPPSGDVQPPIAAATSDATQIAEMLAEMKLMKELIGRFQSSANQGTPACVLPPAPLVSLAGPKVDHDVDRNHTTNARHPEHPNFPQSHDYMAMHTGEKAQRQRTQRLIRVDRLDQQRNYQYTLEQQGSSSQISFEGLEIKTSQGGYNIPLRTSMEYYFLVSTQWLQGLIAGREGCFNPTYPFFEFHKRGPEVVMVRVFFLLATTDMLSHKCATPLPWDIIWRYLLHIAADFKSAPLGDVGMDGDMLQYIGDFGTPKIEMRTCPRMAALAKKHFSKYTLQEVYDSVSQHVPGSGKQRGQDIPKGDNTKKEGGFPVFSAENPLAGNTGRRALRARTGLRWSAASAPKQGSRHSCTHVP